MTFSSLKTALKTFIPEEIWNTLKWVHNLFFKVFQTIYFRFVQCRYQRIVNWKRKKKKITVAFFVTHDSEWKSEGVYRLMERDSRFEPLVVICPYISYGEETMFREMNQAFNAFQSKGYNVIKTYSSETNRWLDINIAIKPDIVFFLAPHPITKKEYRIDNFTKTLTCYIPYTFQTTYNYESMYNRPFHNMVWKAYYQTNIHKQIAVRHADNRGRNVVVTGYPGIDGFLEAKGTPSQYNKSNKTKKSIIWAPHHTIEGEGLNLNFSNFLRYHEFMIELANEYREKVYITFKPHPILRPKLNKKEIWGVERTDKYYNFWKDSDFCNLNEGNYEQLFIESDAMMHDCDSFMGEYLSLDKPVLYTRKDDFVEDRQNEFGKSAMKMHYQAKNEKEIIYFIDKVVIEGEDTLKNLRYDWIKTNLIPQNSKSASLNIFNDLKKSLLFE